MKTRFIKIFLLSGLLFVTGITAAQETILDQTRKLLDKATKADDLYQVRILLKRSKGKQELSISDQQALAESYRLLSGGFARFNHYKNAVEAYTNYLVETEQLINRTRLHQIDSIKSRQANIQKAELAEISSLEQGKQTLVSKRDSLKGSHENFYLWSGLATAALVIFFFVTLMRLNRKTREVRLQLDQTRDEVHKLFRESLAARLNNGIPHYIRFYTSKVSEVLSTLLRPANEQDPAKSPIGAEDFRKSLAGSKSKFGSLSEGTSDN